MSTTEGTGVMERARARPALAAGVALAAIVVASALIRIALSWSAPGPWIFVDELIYSELGKSAFGGTAIRGVPVNGYGPVYPYLIAPAYALFENLVDAYQAVKVTNAIVMSLTAIPAYFIARTLMRRSWALGAAALAVLVPGMGYTAVVMTESAFYPAFALAMLFVVRALTRPTLIRQLLVFAGAVLCFEVRPQGVVIAPAFLASVVLLILMEAWGAEVGSRGAQFLRQVRLFLPTLIISLVAIIAVPIVQTSRGQSLSNLLGAYSTTTDAGGRYQVRPIATWFVLHIAEMDLWLGLLPVLALLVLIGFGFSRRADRNLRVFTAAVVPITLLMTLLVSAFVVFSNVGRIEERNLFYLGFLALIALCWWVSAGVPRQPRWFFIALIAACVLPIAIPYGVFINLSAISDTFGLYLPWAAQNRLIEGMLTPFVVASAVIFIGSLAALMTPKKSLMLVVVVAGLFVVTSAAVNKRTDKASTSAVAQGITGPRDWIDQTVGAGAEVAVLYPGASEPLRVWENEFFNRSIQLIYSIGVPMPGGLPDTVVNANPNGSIVNRPGFPVAADYVLVDFSTSVVGTVIARDAGTGMTLVRASGPLRLSQAVSGVYLDHWTGSQASFTKYDCHGGSVSVSIWLDTFLRTDTVIVTPIIDGKAMPDVSIVPGAPPTVVETRVAPTSGQCQVNYVVASTVVPSQLTGSSDTRNLGVLMDDFSYTPAG